MIFRMGTVVTTVGGNPEELKAVRNLLTFKSLSLDELWSLQREKGQVVVYSDGETGSLSLFNSRFNCFPTGLISYLAFNLPYRIEYMDETRAFYRRGLDKVRPDMLRGIELRQYQIDAITNALIYRRGVVEHATGAGKTEVVAGIIKCLDPEEFPVTILVDTKFLLEQMIQRLEKRGVEYATALYGAGKKEKATITVATIQAMSRGVSTNCPTAMDIAASTVTLICDEAHHAGASTFYNVGAYMLKARNRIGVTMQLNSMPGVFSPFDLHTIGTLGDVIHSISPVYLRQKGYQAQPLLFNIPDRGEAVHWKWPMCYDEGIIRHNGRNSMDILIAYNAALCGRKVLLFVWQKSHGFALLEGLNNLGCDVMFVTGGGWVNKYEGSSEPKRRRWGFKKIQDYVDSPGGKVIIGTTVIDEGADLPDTDMLILSVGGKAFRRMRQRIGRGLRPSGDFYTLIFDHDDGHNVKLREHSLMRNHIWNYDRLPQINISELRNYAGFDLPDYSNVYNPPTLKSTMPEINPGMPNVGQPKFGYGSI